MISSSNQRLGWALIVGAAVIILVWGIRGLAGILNPILLAAVITITLLPVPIMLQKRGMKSGVALLLTIILVLVFIVGFTWLMLSSISNASAEVSSYSTSFAAQNSDSAASAVEQAVQSVMSTLNGRQYSEFMAAFLGIFATTISQVFLTLLIFVFMLYTAISMPDLSRLGINAESAVVDEVISITSDVRRYMALTALINLFVGIGDAILLWIMGVPYALMWGLMAWVLGFIPAVGYWIALIPPVLLTYSLYGTSSAVIVFIGYALINGTAANIISPRVLGKGLSISPLIVFISVFVWGWLLGAIGAILAIPLTMIIIAVLDAFSTTRWMARLMSYVPGSEKDVDTEAVAHAKGLLSQLKDRLPATLVADEAPPDDSADA